MKPELDERVLDLGQRPGDILLFFRPKGFSKIISLLTRSRYYHVAICEDTYHVIECRPKGVVRRDLRSNEGGHDYIVVVPPPRSGVPALEWAKTKLGQKYDGWAAISSIFDRLFRHFSINLQPPGGRFTCGELVACAFKETGANLFPEIDPKDVLPRDFECLIPTDTARRSMERLAA